MSVKIIILVSILLSYFASDARNTFHGKHTTISQPFVKLRTGQVTRCKFIHHDFYKLRGVWYYVLETVTSETVTKKRCGHLIVSETSGDEFKSKLDYMTDGGKFVQVPLDGVFVNDTIVGIPELNNAMLLDPEVKQPYIAQMGICDNNSILFIEPIYYHGVMVFTRNVPESTIGLKLRFGTFDEQTGKEHMMAVTFNCTT